MNATQQATHTRKTDALAHVIADTQEAVIGRFEEVEASFAAMHTKVERLLEKERTDRASVVQLIADRVGDLDARQAALRAGVHAFVGLKFWDRVKWLVVGNL